MSINYRQINFKTDSKQFFINPVILPICHSKQGGKCWYEKVQVDNDQEKANQEEIPTPKTELGKTKLTIRYLYLENIS